MQFAPSLVLHEQSPIDFTRFLSVSQQAQVITSAGLDLPRTNGLPTPTQKPRPTHTDAASEEALIKCVRRATPLPLPWFPPHGCCDCMPQPPRPHASPGCEDLGDRAAEYFREVCGRRCNKLNGRYLLPADEEELKRLEYCHRMVQFIFAGKNYIGPVKEILNAPSRHKRRVLDLGCGGGLWAFEMADEFPQAEVVGIDVAPIQPLFELCDLTQPTLPYPSNYFDIIHARCISTAITDYPALLREITRILRPGGMILLVEMDHVPIADGKRTTVPTSSSVPTVPASGAPGWSSIWDAYARALAAQGFDGTVPHRLGQLVWGTRSYDMSRTYAHQAEIPIGFHNRDPTLLTVGQLAWMDFDLMLGALKPYLQTLRIPDWKIDNMIEDAQADLYYPVVRLSTRLHVVQGIKK